MTGELIQDSTKIQLKFDSATGLPIGINKSQSQGNVETKSLVLSDYDVVDKAKKDAYNDFEGFFWSSGGGPASLWASSILGMMTVDIFTEELVLPVMVGGNYFIPQFFSKINVKIPYYNQLYAKENFSNSQIYLYESEYKKEIQKLRLMAIRKGQFRTVGLCAGIIFLMIVASF